MVDIKKQLGWYNPTCSQVSFGINMDILPVTSYDYGPMTTYSWNCTKEFEVAANV